MSKAWNSTHYSESDHVRIPPGVFWFDSLSKDRKLIVNDTLPSGHWIKTYCARSFVQAKGALPDLTALAKLPAAEESLRKKLLKPPTGAGPKTLEGKSLYDAAFSIKNGSAGAPSKGEAKGLERALRYYMLATYSLIDTLAVQKKGDSPVNNYVAAMLVSQQGAILSVGVNVGSFMHAEVSMLLSYFLNNPTQSKLPEKSLVLSTLTPCMQCTKFLMESRSGKALMYFGQMDKGEFGNIGALDVAGFKKAVAADAKKEYDLSYLGDANDAEVMSLPGIFGKPPKVYNINQAEINDVDKLIAELKAKKAVLKTQAYSKLTDIDFGVVSKDKKTGVETVKTSNTAGQLKSKPEAVRVFTSSSTTLQGKAKIAEHKGKGASGDDVAFRAIQTDVLAYLTRSLNEIQFYA